MNKLSIRPGSNLAKRVKEAQEEIKTWPQWMQYLGKKDMEAWGKDRD